MVPKLRKKKEKQEKKNKTSISPSIGDISSKLNKIDALVEIDKLKNLAINYKVNADFEKAINTADKIMRLAVKFDMPSLIKEQEKFMNTMAEKVQKDYFISKIHDVSEVITDQYTKLIKSNRIMQAHALIEGFKKEYDEFSYFSSIPAVQELIDIDKKNWIKYQVKFKDKYDGIFKDEQEELIILIDAINKYHDELIEDGQLDEANNIIEEFIKKYEDNSNIMSLQNVQTLIKKKREA
ncbi:MAG: hypothetical protein EU539_00240 [Promethearchaeota archaeon]|nr:MAG: hypothetical protein EU539_00240 [Candidatus Lokiarchaeota archaeon]